MIALKPLDPQSIPKALETARNYRLLNEPHEAESICLDILEAAPDHQEAMTILLLALTDTFSMKLYPAFQKALEVAGRLSDRYSSFYYTGIVYERRAKAQMKKGTPGAGSVAYEWFDKALKAFDRAMQVGDQNNQDAVLRWNSCARIINTNPEIKPRDHSEPVTFLDSYDASIE